MGRFTEDMGRLRYEIQSDRIARQTLIADTRQEVTDAAHAFMFARRAAQQAAKLTGGWSGDTMTWFRGDTGETWVGTGCVIEAVPAGASTQSPAAVTWRVLVGYLTIQAPDLIPVTA